MFQDGRIHTTPFSSAMLKCLNPCNFRDFSLFVLKFFSSFVHTTCSLSVSHVYLALDGVYHPFGQNSQSALLQTLAGTVACPRLWCVTRLKLSMARIQSNLCTAPEAGPCSSHPVSTEVKPGSTLGSSLFDRLY